MVVRCASIPPVQTPTLPGTRVESGTELRDRIAPPYRVVLHNDDVNTADYVVVALVRCVPSLEVARAAEIMFKAHTHGEATVVTCHKELAELYRERLESCGLTATIEPA